jgi:predicted RNA-binding protein YlxR (DUF448 family)
MQRAKKDLVRVVRLTEGGVVVDETGKQKGRGAYLCRQRMCWTLAMKRGAFTQALHATLTAEEVAVLQGYAATLPETLEMNEASIPGSENLKEEV